MAQENTIRAIVIDSKTGDPLEGVTITILEKSKSTVTDSEGRFGIAANSDDKLQIVFVGYDTLRFLGFELMGFEKTLQLVRSSLMIEGVDVVNTGYQQLSRERSTGSIDVIGEDVLSRVVSPSVLDRLENVSPGLLINQGDASQSDRFLIRGRSTITADATPLIVVDDFPFDGSIELINPHDIASISVLKDAAAASIWGARAANGVIVITTKHGTSSGKAITYNTSATVSGRPDLDNISLMNSADMVEWERFLFESGRFDGAANALTNADRWSPIPEAVEILIENAEDAEQKLDILKRRNVIEEISKVFYRPRMAHQHNLGIRGGSDRYRYSFQSGYDRERTNLVGEKSQRISLKILNEYKISSRLHATMGIQFNESDANNGRNNGLSTDFGMGISPYTKLLDDNGNGLPQYGFYRKGFVDTVGNGLLQNWDFVPTDEIYRERVNTQDRSILINSGMRAGLLQGLTIDVKYQYQGNVLKSSDAKDEESFAARDARNIFSKINYNTGTVQTPIPKGGYIQLAISNMHSHQGRIQVNYERKIGRSSRLDAIAGYEIRSKVTDIHQNFHYGYNERYSAINPSVDFAGTYPTVLHTYQLQLPKGMNSIGKMTDNFISYFTNVNYTMGNRLVLSGSARKDEANLFGVETNMKGTPLWSLGALWKLSNESFMESDWLSMLNLRLTYGANGNISRVTSAHTRAAMYSGGQTHSHMTATIQRPPNRDLKWEKVKMFNIGLEMGAFNNRISGNIDYYVKNAVDLLAQMPTDPTLGFSTIYTNTAHMQAKGVDVSLRSRNMDRSITWDTELYYSISTNKLTKYLMTASDLGRSYVISLNTISPIIDKPLYGAYSFPWGGLDPVDGAPIGFVDGEESRDYSAIYNGTLLPDMVYHGAVQPVHYGALKNTFEWRKVSLSFNVSYKFGYYFRTPTVYNSGLTYGWQGHGDYAKRWQIPGDEQHTNVPSMIYPALATRDNFYQYSSVHVHRADNIRLEDFNLGYTINNVKNSMLKSVRLFLYCTDIDIIWVRNEKGIDPFYNNVVKPATSYSIGLVANF